MKKKLLIALPVCILLAVAAALAAFVAFHKGEDTLTYFQRKHVQSMLSTIPYIDAESGEIISPVAIAAANDSKGAESDSFLWFRNRYESEASHVELNIAFDREGVPYLADSFDSVTENSVPFERVLRHIVEQGDEDTGFVLNLCEYTSLGTLAANIEQLGLQYRTVIVGVNEISLPAVKTYFAKTPVLCTYDSDTKSSLEELAAAGADGIICKPDELREDFVRKTEELGLLLWVDCEDEFYGTMVAFNFCVDGILSSAPEMANYIYGMWGENLIEDIVYQFYSDF